MGRGGAKYTCPYRLSGFKWTSGCELTSLANGQLVAIALSRRHRRDDNGSIMRKLNLPRLGNDVEQVGDRESLPPALHLLVPRVNASPSKCTNTELPP